MGTIFKIQTDGTGFSKLLDFSGSANGRYPRGDLMSDGTFLYGMTNGGGSHNFGTIFKIMPDGTGFIKLMDLDSADGINPFGSLISDGTFLYGMAYNGGTFNHGTLFRILPDGSNFSVLKDFHYLTIGAHPRGTPTIHNGYLYALITEGGVNGMGTIIRCLPDGTGFSKLMDFSGTGCGLLPWCRPIFDGNIFYAFTVTSDFGTIFKFDASTAGIENSEFQFNLNVYPNPIKAYFVLQAFESIDNGTFNLFDISGKCVMTIDGLTGNEWTIQRNDLSSGMYFYTLTEKGKIIGKGKLIAD